MLINFPKFDEYLSVAVLPFACIGLLQLTKRRRAMIPISLFTIPYFLFMGYIAYAVWVHRFTMIIYVFLYGAAGCGIAALYQKISTRMKSKLLPVLLTLTAALFPLHTLLYPLEYYFSQRGSDAAYDKEIQFVIESTKNNVSTHDVVFSSFVSDYCHIHDFAVIDNLNYDTIDQLTNLLSYYKVSCLMLNRESDSRIISDLQLSGYLKSFKEVSKTDNLVVYQKY